MSAGGKLRAFAPTAASDDLGIATKYVTARNLGSIAKRVKPLPPDANGAASSAKLLQLAEHVRFRCDRCRRDEIFDDSLAFDEASGLMMCVRCYSRLIRPKVYRPTRLVPFPSLLSWLNYEHHEPMQSVPTNPLERAAEAAVPSGARVATGLIAPTSVADLPATPMNVPDVAMHPSQLHFTSAQAQRPSAPAATGTHPCVRVFGSCVHGPLCFFVSAPVDLSLTYLMGLVADAPEGEQAVRVFDLPPNDPMPSRVEADAFSAWISRRRSSDNQAEWQLWNQSGTDSVVDALVPPPAPAPVDVAALRSVLGKLKGAPPA